LVEIRSKYGRKAPLAHQGIHWTKWSSIKLYKYTENTINKQEHNNTYSRGHIKTKLAKAIMQGSSLSDFQCFGQTINCLKSAMHNTTAYRSRTRQKLVDTTKQVTNHRQYNFRTEACCKRKTLTLRLLGLGAWRRMDNHRLARACETEQDVGAAAGMRQWEGYPEVVHLLDFVNSVLHSLQMADNWLGIKENPWGI
jgi:hypothetical protein